MYLDCIEAIIRAEETDHLSKWLLYASIYPIQDIPDSRVQMLFLKAVSEGQ